jgi:16S rRNA G1207 methylase RsmC
MLKLEIKKFNIDSIKNDSSIIMIGKRRTGIAFYKKDLDKYLKDKNLDNNKKLVSLFFNINIL